MQFLPDDRVTSGLGCVEISWHLQITEGKDCVAKDVTVVARQTNSESTSWSKVETFSLR
jgi:hypothetical protein